MSRPKRSAISLVETLVVIGIIVILIGLFLPATRKVRESSGRIDCQNNMRVLLQGIDSFQSIERHYDPASPGFKEAAADGTYPSGCIGRGSLADERLSWLVSVLPFIEQQQLAQRFDSSKGFAGNFEPAAKRMKNLICKASKESTNSEPFTHYIAMAGIGPDAASRLAGESGNGFMGYDRLTTADMIKDGTSNTIALMETRSNVGPWARGGQSALRSFDPADLPLHGDQRPFGGHISSMEAGMADGSVRAIMPKIDPAMLSAAITIAGGEKVELP